MACQLSYPLNSDIASPPGTFAAYLSCLSCADVANPPRMESHTVANPIVRTLLRVITEPPMSSLAVVRLRIHWTMVSIARSAERERERLDAGVEEFDRERAVDDW